MNITQLTEAMHQFVRSQGWYEANSPRPQTLRNLAISLNLEAAEVLEYFQWSDRLENPKALAEELADVCLYLLQIASIAGIDLEQAILDKLENNYQRTWDEQSKNEKSS
jgi:NTP pyrophosphatase (non-canonical NTP hydrolase)